MGLVSSENMCIYILSLKDSKYTEITPGHLVDFFSAKSDETF